MRVHDIIIWPSDSSPLAPSALEEGPADAVKTADAEWSELLEGCGAHVDASDRALVGGACVCDLDHDGLAAIGHLHLAAAHGVAA